MSNISVHGLQPEIFKWLYASYGIDEHVMKSGDKCLL